MKKNRFLLSAFIFLIGWAEASAQTIFCSDIVTISLDQNCQATMVSEQFLESGTCQCPLGTLLEFDKTAPFGDGPWVAPNLNSTDVGQSYQARVTNLANANTCTSMLSVADKVPPKLDCTGLTTVSLTTNSTVNLPVSALQVTATDACSTPAQITLKLNNNQTSVNYNCSNLGLNTLLVTARDGSGNTATCQASVLVTDTLNKCIGGCTTGCPPTQIVTFEEGVFNLLPAWESGNFAPFEAYGTATFDPTCTPSDTIYTLTYQPFATQFSAFVRHWDLLLGGAPWGICEQLIVFPSTRAITVSGKVFLDSVQNCQADASERGVDIFHITGTKLPGNQQIDVIPNADGTYSFTMDFNALDSVLIVQINLPNGFVTVCPSVLVIPDTTTQLQHTMDFGLYAEGQCALPQVTIGTGTLRRCFSNDHNIRYCNLGYTAIQDAYITVALDPLLSIVSADLPYTQTGSLYNFQLGDIPPFSSGFFKVHILVYCNAALGQTLCAEATIYPHEPCGGQPWTGPVIQTSAICEGDSVQLQIQNIGTQNMSVPRNYIVVEDIIMRESGTFTLMAGASSFIKVPANGATWRIEAEQEPGYLEYEQPSSVVEGCGGINFPGLVNAFALNEEPLYKDIDCRTVVGSYDPNDKTATPTGYSAAHIIRANTDLEYTIRFQNTGTDTAFTVVIVDTLSSLLNPATFEAGVSSHPYKLEVRQYGILNFVFSDIMLPDSNVNEAASHGFITFRIAQKPDLSDGNVIENNAAIYFDFNEPVITNTAFHTIGAPYLLVSVDKPLLPETAITIRPNPFVDQAVLEVTGREMRSGLLHLYDMQGRILLTRNFEANQCKIIRGNLVTGTYFFQITDQGVLVGSGKVEVH